MDAVIIDDELAADVEARAVIAAESECIFPRLGHVERAGILHREILFAPAGKIEREMIDLPFALGAESIESLNGRRLRLQLVVAVLKPADARRAGLSILRIVELVAEQIDRQIERFIAREIQRRHSSAGS